MNTNSPFPHVMIVPKPSFPNVRKSRPTLLENAGGTYIEIVSPIGCEEERKLSKRILRHKILIGEELGNM